MDDLLVAISNAAWLVYLLTFALLFAETSGLPLPALSFALFAAALAGQGTVSFPLVVLATILGGTLGGPVGHSLGLRRGRSFLEKMGGRVRLTPERIDSTEEQFERRGKTIVLLRFFVPILPWSAGILAGIAKMPRRTLVLYNFVGITLWALIELTIVAYFSSALQDFLASISISALFWVATGVVGTFFLIRIFRRRRAARGAGTPDDTRAEVEPMSELPTVATSESTGHVPRT